MTTTRRLFQNILPLILGLGVLYACHPEDSNPDPTFEKISDFVIGPSGEKLLATDRGLFTLGEDGKYVQLSPGKDQVLNDLDFGPPGGQNLWISTSNGAMDTESGTLLNTGNSGLSDDLVTKLHFDTLQEVHYLATLSGLDMTQSSNWTHYSGMNGFFTKHPISAMGSSTDGYTYVATLGGGIERFSFSPDGISGATIMDSDWTRLESNRILCLFITDTVQAYGTEKGVSLHYSAYTKWDWDTFLTGSGLNSDTVLSVFRASDRLWWFGTSRGLNSYNEDRMEWKSYSTESHGLPHNEILFLTEDQDASIWIATPAGLARLSEDQVTCYPLPE